MRTFTKPDSAGGERREERYVTSFGVGVLVLAGELPVALELPVPTVAPDAVGPEAAASPPPDATASLWRDLLERYFAGEAVTFPLDTVRFSAAVGHTRFETAVAAALAAIPYGAAASYRDLAVAAGHPNAYRAVGSVMARNPLPVILPCHRVIKNDGRLGEYGGDPAWKRRLLTLEGYFDRPGRGSGE
jgi:methylated-DNA-[protein]-cysteine S-methyltransferase